MPGFSYVPLNKVEKLDSAINDNTAGVLIELIQGEGGVNIATDEFVAAARKLCDQRGALLIIDEIQTGFGRTGKMFACNHHELQPDVMTLAKAIGAGVPMGATMLSNKIKVAPGMHGTTFGGNPLACAGALATLDVIEQENLPDQAEEKGALFEQNLEPDTLSQVRELRRRGLMIGLELKGKVQPVLESLMARGIIALPAGATVLRLLPPLTISYDQLKVVAGELRELLA